MTSRPETVSRYDNMCPQNVPDTFKRIRPCICVHQDTFKHANYCAPLPSGTYLH